MNISKLINESELLLGRENLNRGGGILYSASHTLARGDLYILGFNPGGEDGTSPSISQHLATLPSKTENSYIDETWGDRGDDKKGQAPLQVRIRKLVECIGADLKNVCASNLIFMQSRKATGIKYPEDADACWPVHEKILDIVQPKLIIAFGNSSVSPYRYLFHKLKVVGHEDILDSGHGSWKCRGFEALVDGREVYIAGFPHLSRYSPLNKSGEVKEHLVAWLKGKV